MPVILPAKVKDLPKRERSMRPVKPSRRDRKQYQDSLEQMVDYLKGQTANLSDVIKSGADRVTVARALTQMATQAQAAIDALAPGTAQSFVSAVDKANKKAMEGAISKALSVDFATIIDAPGVLADIQMALTENTSLIKSIASEHFSKVGQAVLDNYRGVPMPEGGSLTQRLQQIGGITKRRAAFIARDQTAKLTGTLNETRATSNGMDEYIWRNSRDNRVVGNPAGKYPKGNKAHGNHWDREGRTYSYNDPPSDGNPGVPIGCRCHAEMKINLEKLAAMYV